MARRPRARTARPVARRRGDASAFDALLIEGALIAPAQMTRISALDAGEQDDAGYRVRPGLTIRDELPLLFKIAQAHFRTLDASAAQSQTAAMRFTEGLLRDVLGFTDLAAAPLCLSDGRVHPVTFTALEGRVPVVVASREDGVDGFSHALTRDGRRTSAALALQDWLNATDRALWGMTCDGERLRLYRDNPSLTRPAYIEADLRRMCEADAFADFTVMWLLLHASRFGAPGTPPADCALERWRDAGQKAGLAARDRLRDGVEQALQVLGTGFVGHAANGDLRRDLQDNTLPLTDFHGLLLRLVYRMIFMLVAEDRGLLHPPDASPAAMRLYAEGYSLSRLRDRAIRRAAWDAHDDLWDGMLIVFGKLGWGGEPTLGLPVLDGLFAPSGLRALEDAALPNRALVEAVFRLAWLRDEGALVPVNWRDMETEELGSVYESLLELTPRLSEDGRVYGFATVDAETRGNQRKTTGSYYTPDSLVQLLLDSALDPVLDRVEQEADDRASALLGVTVLDPACGSGHFLLAAARRIAARVARLRGGGTAKASDYRHALRDVARSCLFGVDRNPMAVELTKVALWIETVEPGKPLGFLDGNIRCGDALLGVFDLAALDAGIPDAAYKTLTGDDSPACRELLLRNRDARDGQGTLDVVTAARRTTAAPLAREEAAWRALPEDSPEQIAAKRARQEAARADAGSYSLRAACDLYIAAFLAPKPEGSAGTPGACLVPTTADVWRRRDGGQVYPPREGYAVDLSRGARAFHWPLEFPAAIARGGFDVVLGNPPWERIKLQEQEYFATEAPEVAEATNAAARGRMIRALAAAPPGSRERRLFEAFEQAKRTAEAASTFARLAGPEGGRFVLTGRGDVNTYALFAELARSATSHRGRAGVIVPTGIATDASTAPFFGMLVAARYLVSAFGFENEEMIFPSVHHAFKFLLLTTSGTRTDKVPDFVFFARETAAVSEPQRRFALDATQIAAINPNTKTAPVFRSRRDAELSARIYANVPVMINESQGASGNPWSVSFSVMFHMGNDSGLFRTAQQLAEAGLVRKGTAWVRPDAIRPAQSVMDLAGGRDDRSLPLDGDSPTRQDQWVPLYEAKMVNFFDHRFGDYGDRGDERGFRVMPQTAAASYADPCFEIEPFYWVSGSDVTRRTASSGWTRNWFLCWKDITASTNERTLIPSLIPLSAVGHTLPIAFPNTDAALSASLLLANWSSLVCDYIVRQKTNGLHLVYHIIKQLPVLPPSAYSADDVSFIKSRVLELTYTSHSIAYFAQDLGHNGPPFAWDEGRRARLRAELDAWYARAYGLTRDELRYILDPADVLGADYPSETFRVLKTSEIRRYDEYRTQRLVLAAWDALHDGTLTAEATGTAGV